MCGASFAEEDEPGEEILLGVADVERILQEYWRTSEVRAELERYKTSEELKKKQDELARLKRELSSKRRFAFFRDKRKGAEIQEKRDELRRLAEKEAQAAREREKEAIEQLLIDVRGKAESISHRSGYVAIFDSNNPHIVFMNTDLGKIEDVTDAVIDDLNFR
jgi:Skp family chaperone for outer membrane proteins